MDWPDRKDLVYGRLFWLCDKLSRGQLTDLKSFTLCHLGGHATIHQMRHLVPMMKCLPLHSCTIDSSKMGQEVYKFLPDSIRCVTDESWSYSDPFWNDEVLTEPCFKNLTTLHVMYLRLNAKDTWVGSPPVNLQHLTVSKTFTCSEKVLPHFAEMFPALTSVDVTALCIDRRVRVLQQLLQLPQLARADFHFSGEFVMGLATKQLSRVVLAPPDTVTLHVVPYDGMVVDLVQAKDLQNP